MAEQEKVGKDWEADELDATVADLLPCLRPNVRKHGMPKLITVRR